MNELINSWLNNGKDISPHLKASLEKLSPEHISGISLAQLDSPMMKQFRTAKEEVPDALLFFRMGDFYELFGADAIIVSDVCGLTLTSRDKSSTNPVPMAGAPVAGYKTCLKKCVLAGFKVAICDQVEDPRQAKGIVRREITRIATPAMPGDLDDDDSQKEKEFGCYLACVLQSKEGYTLSFIDVSTSEFRITARLNEDALTQEIATIRPKEIITTPALEKPLAQKLKLLNFMSTVNKIENWILRSENNCKELFCEFFSEDDIHHFGLSSLPLGLEAVGALLFYLKSTQKNILKNIQFIKYYEVNHFLLIDNSTKKHLDFFTTSTGEKKGSVFHFLNRCSTAAGSRHLVRRLNYPFKDVKDIQECHAKIECFLSNSTLLYKVIETLRQTADIERFLARAAQKSLDPRGAVWIRKTLEALPFLKECLSELQQDTTLVQNIILSAADLLKHLSETFVEEPANQAGKNGIIFKTGYHAELDEIIELEVNFNEKLDALEKFERERSQIPTLKIGYTRVFGYYFEISKGKLAQVPAHFLRKQTLSTGERFITTELKELEEKALSASERRLTLERELLEECRLRLLNDSKELLLCADFIAALDLICTFSVIAIHYSWTKPTLVLTNTTILKECVHPILASLQQENFVPNNIELGELPHRTLEQRPSSQPMLHLITGPNMAGKSTLMRQVALAQILCQMGCFVPAASACLGIVDRILTRIGSADHALKSQSTFMVEMLETANIIRLASPQSLLILDEIGRGTSTYDGVSLAWSILEYLHDVTQARTLFSTHYHELSDVCLERKNMVPMQMAVLEQPNLTQRPEEAQSTSLVFSRKYVPGCAGKSYGIMVAKLAGLPPEIIQKAEVILKNLETQKAAKYEPMEKKKPKKADPASDAQQTLF